MRLYSLMLKGSVSMLTLFTITATAQESVSPAPSGKEPIRNNSEKQIIIRNNGGHEEKMTVVIDGDKITINGKPLVEYQGGDIVINKNRLGDLDRLDDLIERNIEIVVPDGSIEPGMKHFSFRVPSPHVPGPKSWNFNEDGEEIGKPRAMLGVTADKGEKGAVISGISENSAAAKVGLAKGDVITAVDGNKITDQASLASIIQTKKPGDEVLISFIREKKTKKIKVKLGEARNSGTFDITLPLNDDEFMDAVPRISEGQIFPYLPPKNFSNKGWERDLYVNDRPRLGVQIEETKDSQGVKVMDVKPDSPGEKAGLKEDDIITQVDGKEANSVKQAINAIHDARDKTSFPIKLLRNGAPLKVEVRMPRPLRKADL